MTKTTSIVVLMSLICATRLSAQTSEPTRIFISVNGGLQSQSQTLGTTFSVANINGQDAKFATENQELGKGGIFDFSVGYRFLPQLGVAVGYSYYSKNGTIAATATIPNPLFFNQPTTVNLPTVSEKRTERNIYIIAEYFLPITEQFELAFFAGPSGTRVHQDFVNSVFIPSDPLQTTATVNTESGRAWGANVGVEANYLLNKHYGGGIFIRYNGGSVDTPSATGLKAGGFQVGIGARLRF